MTEIKDNEWGFTVDINAGTSSLFIPAKDAYPVEEIIAVILHTIQFLACLERIVASAMDGTADPTAGGKKSYLN